MCDFGHEFRSEIAHHEMQSVRNLPIESAVVAELRRRGSYSRIQLSRQLAVAPSTIGIHVDRLLTGGYLREAEKEETQSGRPPTRLELNPDAGHFIGVDLDAREIHGVSVDFAQSTLNKTTESIRSGDSVVDVLKGLKQVIRSIRDPSRELLGIGLAMPGTVDRDKGIGLNYQFIRGWKNVPLVDEIIGEFGVPVSLENNVRTMALAERWFGQARNVDHAICIGIRSGIGSGAIIDGELYRGPTGFAGEIGGWPIVVDGTETTLQEVASLRAVLARLASAIASGHSTSLRLTGNQVTCADMLDAARSSDPLVIAELHKAAVQVSRAIVQIVLVADPQKVILCGPLATLTNAFEKPLCEAAERFLPSSQSLPEIVTSKLGDFIGALGAAALPARHWQPGYS